jgi:hypothetical protein
MRSILGPTKLKGCTNWINVMLNLVGVLLGVGGSKRIVLEHTECDSQAHEPQLHQLNKCFNKLNPVGLRLRQEVEIRQFLAPCSPASSPPSATRGSPL